jgi:TetR/AcrR family transcriptional repressor of nem operon
MASLDDILAEAELTKGAVYFHFPSKQALALAIVDDLTEMSRAAVTELLARKMSGLMLAVQDTQHQVARAGARLLETLDNTTTPQTVAIRDRVQHHPHPKAVADRNVVDHHDP